MSLGVKHKAFAVCVVAMLLAGCSIAVLNVYHPSETEDTEVTGYWHMIGSVAYDEQKKHYTYTNDVFDMFIRGTSGEVFYGESQNVDFTGCRIDDNIVFEYYTTYGYVSAMGQIRGTEMYTCESHYYSTSGVDHWYVCYCTYSKNANATMAELPSSPSISLKWESWSSESLNADGNYVLKGSIFAIQEQVGPFFRAEMEQQVGDETVTKMLNGIFVNSYTTERGQTVYMGYMVDESRILWNVTVSPTTLILRTNTTSEVSDIKGQVVAVERIYRAADILGPPKVLDIDDTLLGKWRMTEGYSVDGLGELGPITTEVGIDFTKKENALFAGDGTGDAALTWTAFAVTNSNYEGGYLYHVMSQTADLKMTTGYSWISEDGQTMHMVSFWMDDESDYNGCTYYTFQRMIG